MSNAILIIWKPRQKLETTTDLEVRLFEALEYVSWNISKEDMNELEKDLQDFLTLGRNARSYTVQREYGLRR